MMKHLLPLIVSAAVLVPAISTKGQSGDREGHVMTPPPAHWNIPDAPVLPPDESLATFALEPGFELELVAAEPMVHDPVALAFDGNGRMWVAEMLGYMPDIDGKKEIETYGRISVLEDTDGDGKVDRHTVFLEDYLLPRAVALVDSDRTLLFADNEQLYEAEILIDEDGSIRAGEVVVVDENYAAGGNPEHKPNGLVRAVDNWIYNAKSDLRYRKIEGAWVKQKTESRGQWGIVQDNFGKLLSNANSNLISVEDIPPGLRVRNPDYTFRTSARSTISDQRLWPSRVTPGVNRGYMEGTLTEDGYLAKPTAASGMALYRGDQFPSKFTDSIFITEPSGNLVKRAVMEERGNGFRSVRSAYKGSEFLTSTDERSRMVNAYTAPDGTLYLLDFYRGIIQHQIYMTSYLRAQVIERELDSPIGLGRIWRVRHREGSEGSGQPRMQGESSAELVSHLSHPNGWWRDTAQRLIVERGGEGAVPDLRKILSDGTDEFALVHAVWALEGLGKLDAEVLEAALSTDHPRAAAEAVRAAESLATEEGAEKIFNLLVGLRDSDNIPLRRQLAASLGLFGEKAVPILAEMVVEYKGDLLLGDLAVSGLRNHELAFFRTLPASHSLRPPLIETIVKRNSRSELDELAELLETPKEFESLAKAAVTKRRTEEAKALLEILAKEDTSEKVREGIVKGMLSGGADKQFRPMPVRELAGLDAVGEANRKKISALFTVGSGEEEVFLVTEEHKRQFRDGERHYQLICMGCHQVHGNGQEYLAPPLVGSEWVLESEDRLIALVIDGVMGPIEVLGKTYTVPEIQPIMPGIRFNPDFTDEQLADIMTYVRNAWGNGASPVSPESVTRYRESVPPRAPWTPEDLIETFK